MDLLQATKWSHLYSFKDQRTHRPRGTFQNQFQILLKSIGPCQDQIKEKFCRFVIGLGDELPVSVVHGIRP